MVQKAAHGGLERVVHSCDIVTLTQTLYERIVGEDINTPFIFDALPFTAGVADYVPLYLWDYMTNTLASAKNVQHNSQISTIDTMTSSHIHRPIRTVVIG